MNYVFFPYISEAQSGPIPPMALHFGTLMVGGRPVCDDLWSEEDAKVVCRELGFGDKTKALAITNSKFGSVSSDFLIDNVECKGTEATLRKCKYDTSNNCGGDEGAGVVCVDPDELKLKGGAFRDGNVFIQDYPVCDRFWETRDAQVS